jgi:hypothetical protein
MVAKKSFIIIQINRKITFKTILKHEKCRYLYNYNFIINIHQIRKENKLDTSEYDIQFETKFIGEESLTLIQCDNPEILKLI